MRNFNNRDNRESRDSRDRGDRGRDRAPRPEMHKTTCSDCGVLCEVPFRPTSGKPVYCSNCFSGREEGGQSSRPRRDFGRDSRQGGSRGGFGRSNDRGGRDDRGERKMFKVVCDECGVNCEVPFEPSSDKPIYCDDCFSKTSNSRRNNKSESNSSFDKQFELLNSKLDKLVEILSAPKEVIKLSSEKKDEDKKDKKVVSKKTASKPVIKKIATKEPKKEVKKVIKEKTKKEKIKKETKKK